MSCMDLVNVLFAGFLGSFRNKQGSSERLQIPFEIIIDILSWLPVESLVRFKCVCTQWFLLIDGDKKFIAKQSGRGSHSLLHYYQKRPEVDYIEAISDGTFEFRETHSGLCLETRVNSNYVARIRNPATRHVVYLPHAHRDTYMLSFALDSTGECKVVCTYSIRKENDEEFGSGGVGFLVLTVGKDDQWRALKHPTQQKHKERPLAQLEDMDDEEFEVLLDQLEDMDDEEFEVLRYCSSVRQSGSFVHISEIIIDDGPAYVEICHLDMFSESFTITTLTNEVFPGLTGVSYLIWNGRLAIAEITDVLSILVLEDSKQQKWNENKIIIPLKLMNDDPLVSLINASFSFDQLLFATESLGFLLYDMNTDCTRVVEPSEFTEEYLAPLKSSLLHIKGMNSE